MTRGHVSTLYPGAPRRDPRATLARESTAAPDQAAVELRAKYARVVDVRIGIRLVGRPEVASEIRQMLGLVAS